MCVCISIHKDDAVVKKLVKQSLRFKSLWKIYKKTETPEIMKEF